MRFRIQVDLGPQSRIAIFRPDENHLVTADLYTKMSMNKKKKLSSRFGQAMDEAKSVDN
jgi:hypothetical protein